MSERRKKYTIRTPYLYQARHFNDKFLNLGYDYRGKILKNGTSPELWANPLQTSMYSTIEGMISFILEQAKYVKKWMSIAHSKDTTQIN